MRRAAVLVGLFALALLLLLVPRAIPGRAQSAPTATPIQALLPAVVRGGPSPSATSSVLSGSPTPLRRLTATATITLTATSSRTVTTTPTDTSTPTATATRTATATATPTRTPLPEPEVVVENDTTYTSLSARYVVGEIHNIGANDAYNARVTARFFDGTGAFVALQEGYGMLTRIAPGQRVPFFVLLLNAPQGITRYTLTVSAQPSTVLDYRPITVVNQQVRDNSGPEVFGDIRNDQQVRVNNIKIVVTFYNTVGAVVHVGEGYLLEGLAAGAMGGYRITTFRSGLSFARYRVQAEGYTN